MAKITDLSSNVWIGEPTEEDMSTLLLHFNSKQCHTKYKNKINALLCP